MIPTSVEMCADLTGELLYQLHSSLKLEDNNKVKINGNILNVLDRLNDDTIRLFLNEIPKNNRIEELKLDYHNLTSLSLNELMKCIPQLPNLKVFDLNSNDISSENFENFISVCNKLQSLDLSNNVNMGSECAHYIGDFLQRNQSLKSLYLNNCGFDLTGILAIITSLYENTTLECLELNRPLLHATTQEDICDHLSRLLLLSSIKLKHISLRYSYISDMGIQLMVSSLYRHNCLYYLDLECNKITYHGILTLTELLSKQTDSGISVLKLSHNDLRDKSGIAIAKMLQVNRRLTSLTLKSCHLSLSLSEIGKALYTNNILENIAIFGNEFHQETLNIWYQLLVEKKRDKRLVTDCKIYQVDQMYYISEKNDS